VNRSSYAHYWKNDVMGTWGGDWSGGKEYPGNNIISGTSAVDLKEFQLVTGTNGLFLRTPTVIPAHLNNGMLHTSTAFDGPGKFGLNADGTYDGNQCWHCHQHAPGSTTVTSLAGGLFHKSLDGYQATVNAAVTAVAQPTGNCASCHKTMLPQDIVMPLGTVFAQPMDHNALFTDNSSASALECSVCHVPNATTNKPGTSWSNGVFHKNIKTAGKTPKGCVNCHLLLMADDPSSQKTATGPGGKYPVLMGHFAATLTTQACESCHTGALAAAATSGTALTLWSGGKLHSSLTTQPVGCVGCHTVSTPPTQTQSSLTPYVFAKGGTSSNSGQWINHASTAVTGLDCVTCHASDISKTASAWKTNDAFHAPTATKTVKPCGTCHGSGPTAPGTNNNMPLGKVDSVTLASSTSSPAGTVAQFNHADGNVLNLTNNGVVPDCSVCHTQVGSVATGALKGKEWSGAAFHKNALSLSSNGTSNRCASCHISEKPGTGYALQDHSAFTETTGQDCGSCHGYPGVASATVPTPNWLGASGRPHPAMGPTSTSGLDCASCHDSTQTSATTKHLTVATSTHFGGVLYASTGNSNGNTCTSCHIDFTAFTGPNTNLKYGHSNANVVSPAPAKNASPCETCHKYSASIYTTLTTTPVLLYPVNQTTGLHQFSQAFAVSASRRADTNGRPGVTNTPHTATDMNVCGSCHKYGQGVWQWVHDPNNTGVTHSKSTSGCNRCH
jgi:hypothetical protein